MAENFFHDFFPVTTFIDDDDDGTQEAHFTCTSKDATFFTLKKNGLMVKEVSAVDTYIFVFSGLNYIYSEINIIS